MLDKKLLALLVCPSCKGELHYDYERQELVCGADRLAFPVRDGIPVMLTREAREISSEESDKWRKH
ncbi:MAG: Trm112 family protein [Pseudohongiellaceae bacterium]